MDTVTSKVELLKAQIFKTEEELRQLKTQLAELEASTPRISSTSTQDAHNQKDAPDPQPPQEWKWPLSESEYTRYGRQLILPTIGIQGQLRLKSASILIIGAGGLGCPAAAYLAGSGIGTLGIADGDVVELSNLHRQIAHSTARIGAQKVHSLIEYCRHLNPGINYVAHAEHLSAQNAEAVVRDFDLVLDCTDHPTSRYLISDICVLLGKTLVSASALRSDGQLIVLNHPPAPRGALDGGPCYRCVFPRPPPADAVVSCGEGGILGPVVGVMGVLQALEAIKLVVGGVGEDNKSIPREPSLLLFSANASPPFRSVKMRGRRSNCFACAASSKLTLECLKAGSLDYVQFCGVAAPIDVLRPEERVSVTRYNSILANEAGEKGLLLDVREKEHFDVANIPGAVNVPFSIFQSKSRAASNGDARSDDWLPGDVSSDVPIYVVCRLGNDSQIVTKKLKDMGFDRDGERFIGDIKGGMRAWKQEIDQTMPFT